MVLSQLSPQGLAQWLIENVLSTTAFIKSHVRECLSTGLPAARINCSVMPAGQQPKKLPVAYVLEELSMTGFELHCGHCSVTQPQSWRTHKACTSLSLSSTHPPSSRPSSRGAPLLWAHWR